MSINASSMLKYNTDSYRKSSSRTVTWLIIHIVFNGDFFWVDNECYFLLTRLEISDNVVKQS